MNTNTTTPAMNPHDINSNLHGWYQEGWDAFYDNVARGLNPYTLNPYGGTAGDAWEEGWLAARINDRECREMGGY
jgi:hypothetical protein